MINPEPELEHCTVIRRRDYSGSPCVRCEDGIYCDELRYNYEFVECNYCLHKIPMWMTKRQFAQLVLSVQKEDDNVSGNDHAITEG